MNNTDKNILIAEFMGLELETTLKGFEVYAIRINRNNPKKENDINTEFYEVDELKYHLSWDWLMPVVQTCKDNQILGSQNFINNIDNVLTCDCNLINLYTAIVEFIKYWNKLQKTKEIKIDNDENDIFVTCPHCDNCEQQPIDQQRHHLQVFEILDWLPTEQEYDENEKSKMLCSICNKEFILEWEYKDENTYYLFGQDAIDIFEEGKDIEEISKKLYKDLCFDFNISLAAFNEDTPFLEVLKVYDGWNGYLEINKGDYYYLKGFNN